MTENKSSMIKEAEQNVLNIAKAYNAMFDVIDALQRYGNKSMVLQENINMYFEGLHKIRTALCAEQNRALATCFVLSGVGGEESTKYAKEKLEVLFDEDKNYNVSFFISQYGNSNSSVYNQEKLLKFKKEVQNKLKDVIE